MPLYFFWGEEDYNIELELKKLKAKILGNEITPLNYRKLDNPNFEIFDQTLRSVPMMFGDIMYVIKVDKYFLESSKKFTLEDFQINELTRAIENIANGIHIVLLCPIERSSRKKPDSRKKLFKAVSKIATVKEFEAFKPYEDYKIAPWIKNAAKEKQIEMAQDVIMELIHTTGANLRDLDTQLEKLKLSAYPAKTITKKMVEDVANVNRDIFALSDLILEKKYTNALNEISNILEKSHYLEILAFLQTSILKLLQTKIYSKSLSGFDLARKLSQHEFVVKKNLEKLANVDVEELIRLKLNLTNCEYMLKTGAITDPILAFQTAFLEGAKC